LNAWRAVAANAGKKRRRPQGLGGPRSRVGVGVGLALRFGLSALRGFAAGVTPPIEPVLERVPASS
jgi:hypothetical protein